MNIKPYYSQDGITIYHGDCREILPHLPKVDLVLTDPPFSQETHSGARTGGMESIRDLVDFGSITPEQLLEYVSLTRKLCDKWQVLFCDWRHMLPLEQQNGLDLELIRFGIWAKPAAMPQMSGDRPATGWEAIAFLHPKGKKIWNGHGRSSVFACNPERLNRVHPTQKPTRLIGELTTLFSNEGETILDPFMGSGVTLFAARNNNRKAIGIEIEEKYVEIAIKRLSQGVLPI